MTDCPAHVRESARANHVLTTHRPRREVLLKWTTVAHVKHNRSYVRIQTVSRAAPLKYGLTTLWMKRSEEVNNDLAISGSEKSDSQEKTDRCG